MTRRPTLGLLDHAASGHGAQPSTQFDAPVSGTCRWGTILSVMLGPIITASPLGPWTLTSTHGVASGRVQEMQGTDLEIVDPIGLQPIAGAEIAIYDRWKIVNDYKARLVGPPVVYHADDHGLVTVRRLKRTNVLVVTGEDRTTTNWCLGPIAEEKQDVGQRVTLDAPHGHTVALEAADELADSLGSYELLVTAYQRDYQPGGEMLAFPVFLNGISEFAASRRVGNSWWFAGVPCGVECGVMLKSDDQPPYMHIRHFVLVCPNRPIVDLDLDLVILPGDETEPVVWSATRNRLIAAAAAFVAGIVATVAAVAALLVTRRVRTRGVRA